MKVFVTGANGFIGTALLKALIVRKIDTVAAARHPVADTEGLKWVQCNELNRQMDWSLLFHGADTIIHLAGRAHVLKEDKETASALFRTINVEATIRLAEQARVAGVKKFVFVSSTSIYGQVPDTVLTETSSFAPTIDADAYASSKIQAERALITLHSRDFAIVIVRPPLVYGPGCKANLYRLLQLVALGLPLPFGSVHNRRSLIGVDNLADFLIACAIKDEANGQSFVIADEEITSLPSIVSEMGAGMGKHVRFFPFPWRALRPLFKLVGKAALVDKLCADLVVDAAFARKTLGWQQPHSMVMGLRETGQWFYEKQSFTAR